MSLTLESKSIGEWYDHKKQPCGPYNFRYFFNLSCKYVQHFKTLVFDLELLILSQQKPATHYSNFQRRVTFQL